MLGKADPVGEGLSPAVIYGGRPRFTLLLFQIKEVLLIAIILLNVEWIIAYIVLFLLFRKHLVEQFLDLLTVLALVPVGVVVDFRGAAHVFFHYFVQVLAGIRHQNIVGRLVTLISFAQFVYFFQGFGLLILLGIQTGMHIQIADLLLGIECHILILFDLHLLVDVEHGAVVE